MTHLLIIIIYLAFISLGLPDALLGSAWPNIYVEFNVSVSSMGIISMLISGCTIVSALLGERIIKRFGTGVVTGVSVAMTAVGLLGFSLSTQFWHLIVWSLPYGLGAGAVDSALNNYVALNYKSRHMSWLHCFWGLGCTIGPALMSYFLLGGQSWTRAYSVIFIIQVILCAVIFISLPLWKKSVSENGDEPKQVLGLRKTVAINGVKETMLAFFCYCAMEATAGAWAVSYVVFEKGIDADRAAGWGSLFYIGIMVGRFINGFLSEKYSDRALIRLGSGIIAAGIAVLFLPLGNAGVIAAFILIGLGCAPIYPCIVHSTPYNFGKECSSAIIGVEMASAYVGTTFMPPLFGLIAEHITTALLPLFLLIFLAGMVLAIECVNRITKKS